MLQSGVLELLEHIRKVHLSILLWNSYELQLAHLKTTTSCSLLIWFVLLQENLKPLVIYVIESFSDQLMKFEHFGSIQAFKLKYQQVGPLLVYSWIVSWHCTGVPPLCLKKKPSYRCTTHPHCELNIWILKPGLRFRNYHIWVFFAILVVKSGQIQYGLDSKHAYFYSELKKS
jgi:hypothetical protein